MARLHADSVIRPSYVREVCRLLRVSNINLVRSDIEFADNQEEMNRERLSIKSSTRSRRVADFEELKSIRSGKSKRSKSEEQDVR